MYFCVQNSSYFLHSTIPFNNDGEDDEHVTKMATKLIDDKTRYALGRSFSTQPQNQISHKSYLGKKGMLYILYTICCLLCEYRGRGMVGTIRRGRG